MRAILTLFAQVKGLEQREGEWDGGDVVALLAEWFDAIGLCPEQPLAELAGHVVTTAREVGAESPVASTTRGGLQRSAAGDVEVDLDRVADLVRARGVECEIDTPGGGVAVLFAGRPQTEPVWAFPWAVQVGPGRFAWDAPATGSLRDLRIGPDTPDPSRTVLLRELGATTEEQIADAVLTQARLATPENGTTGQKDLPG